jgi:hypothetical protein
MLAPHRRFLVFEKTAMHRNQRQSRADGRGLGETDVRRIE